MAPDTPNENGQRFNREGGVGLSERICYMGLADDDGIEVFIPCASAMQNTMHLRAQANRGQNSLVFRCSIEENSARLILAALERGETKIALLALKCMHGAEQATVEVEQDQHHRWDIIPRGSADDIVAASIETYFSEINSSSNSPMQGFISDDMEG